MSAAATYMHQRYHELKAAGLCVTCKEPVVPGRCRCAECIRIARLKRRERLDSVHAPSTVDSEVSLCGCVRWDGPRDSRKGEDLSDVTCRLCLAKPVRKLREAFARPATQPRWGQRERAA